MPINYLAVLRRNPRFARIWLAEAISLVGDWFSLIALAVLVSRVSGGSGLAVSALLLAQLLPSVIIGPWAGVLVDRLDRRHVMIASDVLRAFVTIGFLTVRGPEDLWLVYVLTVAQFALSAVFLPARSAILPNIVRPEDLVAANVIGSVTWSAMLALGGLLGGVVAAQFGVQTGLMLNALSFVLSAVLVWSVRPAPGETFVARRDADGRVAAQGGVRDGLRYLRAEPRTAALLLLKGSTAIISIEALRIVYATLLYDQGDQGAWALGVLSAAAGVGAVLGPLVLQPFNDGSTARMRRLMVPAFLANTVALLLLANVSLLIPAALCFLLRAMGGSAVWTFSAVMIQQETVDAVRGRVVALDLAINQAAAVFGTVLIGWLVERGGAAGIRDMTTQLGLLTIVPLVIWVVLLVIIERVERVGLAS